MLVKVSIVGLALSLLSAVTPGKAQAEKPPLSLEQKIESYLQPYLEAEHFSGTLLIARAGEVVYERSFGLANREHGVPNTPRTKFCAGSINKPMTTVILARLLELERLALTDKLSKFFPEFPRGDEITIRDLLRHTAGIPPRVTEPLDEMRPQTPASMVELAAGKDLLFEPGADSVYSSPGFSVLARVLELAGGKPYAELLAEHVLVPAGMVDTSDAGSRAIVEGRAQSYYFDTDGLLNAAPADISHLVGAGSVYSTPRDLLAMQRALLAGKLGQRARDLLVHESGGLSWNGMANGYRAFADYEVASRISVVAVDPELFRSYEGAYELRPGRNLELRVLDGRVEMEGWLLIPISERRLFSPQDYAEVEVVLDENGGATRLDWTTNGETYPLPKVE
jgi:CubicO group peptidase (beta-lactamase class C family)